MNLNRNYFDFRPRKNSRLFNSCRTLHFFQLLHWKALCFQVRWGKRRYIIFNLSSKRLTVALNSFKPVQTDNCILICMDSNGPCLLFRPFLWLFRLVPPLFLATFISFLHSPEIRNFHSPKRAWNTKSSVEVLEKTSQMFKEVFQYSCNDQVVLTFYFQF